MGQQQLILLALAVVIVGAAIVVGIRAFSENSIKNNADNLLQDAVRMANDMQAWKQKPAPFGGQASVATQSQVEDPDNFTGATFALLGYGGTGTGLAAVYRNLNGQFQLGPIGDGTSTITGRNTTQNNEITVLITGLADTTLTGTITCLGGRTPAGASCTVAAF